MIGFVTLQMSWAAEGMFWVGLASLLILAGLGWSLLRASRSAATNSQLMQQRQLEALEGVLAHAKQMGDRAKALDDVATSFGTEFAKRLDSHAAAFGETTSAVVEPMLRQLQSKLVHATDERRQADRQAAETLAENTRELVQSFEKATDRLLESHGQQSETVLAFGRDLSSKMTDRFAEVSDSMSVIVEAQREAAQTMHDQLLQTMQISSDRDLARSEEIVQLAKNAREDMASWAADARLRFEAQQVAEQQQRTEWQEQQSGVFAKLDAVRGDFATAVAHHEQQLAEMIERFATQQSALEEAQQQRAQALAEVLQQQSGEQLRGVEGLAVRLEAHSESALSKQLGALEQWTDTVSQTFSTLSERMDAESQVTAEQLREATSLVRTGGVELGSLAEHLADAIHTHRQAQEETLRALATVDQGVVQAGERAAAESLAQLLTRTHELFDQQLELQEALLAEARGDEAMLESIGHDLAEDDVESDEVIDAVDDEADEVAAELREGEPAQELGTVGEGDQDGEGEALEQIVEEPVPAVVPAVARA